jgi:hypothetical protein
MDPDKEYNNHFRLLTESDIQALKDIQGLKDPHIFDLRTPKNPDGRSIDGFPVRLSALKNIETYYINEEDFAKLKFTVRLISKEEFDKYSTDGRTFPYLW